MESENAKISNEIEGLTRSYVEGAPVTVLIMIIVSMNDIYIDSLHLLLQIIIIWRVISKG